MIKLLWIWLLAGASWGGILLTPMSAAADELDDLYRMAEKQQYQAVAPILERYLLEHPKDARARFLHGLILTEQKKPEEAIKVFHGLTLDYPELPEPYNNLAVLYADQGSYENARHALLRAIQTHPSYTIAHENLGDIYAKMASQAYSKALQLNQDNTTAKSKLAMVKRIFSTEGGSRQEMLAKVEPRRPELPTKIEPIRPEPPAKVAPVAPVAKIEPSRPEPPAKVVKVEPPVVEPPPPPPRRDSPASTKTPAKGTPPVADKGEEGSSSSATTTEEGKTKEALLQTVQHWAAAWSSRDPVKYLSFYAADFQPPPPQTRAAWEHDRKARVRKPKSIVVKLNNIRLTLQPDGQAQVLFYQDYKSDQIHDRTNKMLILKKEGGQWKIVQELIHG